MFAGQNVLAIIIITAHLLLLCHTVPYICTDLFQHKYHKLDLFQLIMSVGTV